MKPFSLEEFKKNPSRKIVTRSGDPVQILCTTAKSTHPIVALIKYPLEYEETIQFRNDGSRYNNESAFDLFFAPTKHEGWANIYRINSVTEMGTIYATKEEALVNALGTNYIDTVYIEWEE